ncbi:hypothetical protein G9A89_021727 [Geosiphon pyriformis]|nr:hypothetical protein G9A89_021727 [Geosiphon pyriformis]
MSFLRSLYIDFNSILDPGGEDENLIECISTWCYDNKYKHDQLFKELYETTRKKLEFSCMLAFCYHHGIGTAQDQQAAFKWYSKAAEIGDSFGQNQLGWCFHTPLGTQIDCNKAFYWYEKAAESGNPSGQANLGFCYRNAVGTKVDLKKAFYWYSMSAKAGDCLGQCNFARCYLSGWGTESDIHLAINWYKKAQKNRSEFAPLTLKWFLFLSGHFNSLISAKIWTLDTEYYLLDKLYVNDEILELCPMIFKRIQLNP